LPASFSSDTLSAPKCKHEKYRVLIAYKRLILQKLHTDSTSEGEMSNFSVLSTKALNHKELTPDILPYTA